MLSTIDGQAITSIPKRRQSFYQRIRNRMSDTDYDAVMNELQKILDNTAARNKKVVTSSFVPGSDWSGTVYDSIYSACKHEADPMQYSG